MDGDPELAMDIALLFPERIKGLNYLKHEIFDACLTHARYYGSLSRLSRYAVCGKVLFGEDSPMTSQEIKDSLLYMNTIQSTRTRNMANLRLAGVKIDSQSLDWDGMKKELAIYSSTYGKSITTFMEMATGMTILAADKVEVSQNRLEIINGTASRALNIENIPLPLQRRF